ncbi:MAG: efflux RND transporter periplasmic adaptor subunit [Mucilaginibacter polytrichastri]|nr:efflux RND transporter periplasmic adaptor subunit [Mucilaginibacter polytrichastri]
MSVPVLEVGTHQATTYQEFTASVQGSRDVEIRPQVNGYLDQIYIDEGAHVKKGQALFRINEQIYREEFNTAKANLAAAKARMADAQITVSKLEPLVQNKVISDVQLKGAQAAYDAQKASVEQAQAMVKQAGINLGYTIIKAPADGYIGRIPFKSGSLVGTNTPEALTVISEIDRVYVYFSMSEADFMNFKKSYGGQSLEEKIKRMPPVELQLADQSLYPEKGRVELASGQFDGSMGALSFRAVFDNRAGLLRSGNTGKIRIPHTQEKALMVPQEATYELQDKLFVYTMDEKHKISSEPITVSGTSGNFYLVKTGLKAGEKIVYSGLDRLSNGATIKPEPFSIDSLMQKKDM